MGLIERWAHRRFVRASRQAEQRLGAGKGIRWVLSYVFPDHWSFLLGEIALYSFIILVGTGIFLTLYYIPDPAQTIYHGPFAAMDGEKMSVAFKSVLNLSTVVPAGLLLRQAHHWAADIFIAAIVLHLTRIMFTGAFRKPRDFNFYIGLTMLMLAILEGFAGYSLVDDLLSGMGLVIAYAVALSIPGIGAQLAYLIWGGAYPGKPEFWPRLEIIHVFVIPLALIALITVHLVMIMRQHHSQFPGPGRRERNVVGTPMWPAYALRSIGLLMAVASVIFLLGGLIQINPIFQWGPYHPYLSTNGAQPDWYIGWLIGALRLMPNYELAIGNYTLIPNPFWGGAFFPLAVFGVLFAWPAAERRITRDYRRHDLLDRPRDRPIRSGLIAGFLAWVWTIFAIGAADRVYYRLHISYPAMIKYWRAASWLIPVIVFLATWRICRSLQKSGSHPLRSWQGDIVRRRVDGGIEVVGESPDRVEAAPSEEPVGTIPGQEG
jgi:ubiquinol-cytochrome c reductase cytochrome b subunit